LPKFNPTRVRSSRLTTPSLFTSALAFQLEELGVESNAKATRQIVPVRIQYVDAGATVTEWGDVVFK